MKPIRATITLVMVVGAILLARPVLAQQSSDTQGKKAELMAAYRQGRALFKAGSYQPEQPGRAACDTRRMGPSSQLSTKRPPGYAAPHRSDTACTPG